MSETSVNKAYLDKASANDTSVNKASENSISVDKITKEYGSNSSGNKSVLLISHDSLLGGATIALQYAARTLKKNGCYVTWLCTSEGAMLRELEKDGINYIVDPTIHASDEFLKYSEGFDLCIPCTVTLYDLVEKLKNKGMNIMWWVHEAEEYFKLCHFDGLTKKNIEKTLCVCVGKIPSRNIKKYLPYLQTNDLIYGVPDFYKSSKNDGDTVKTAGEVALENTDDLAAKLLNNPEHRKIFLSIGTIEKRKGQDILVDAIKKLSREDLAKALFVFIGREVDSGVFKKVTDLCNEMPDAARFIGLVNRETLMSIYRQSDVVLCSSREDPMPVFVTEALMQHRVVICSENTGSAGVLTEGKDGFIYKNNDPAELSEKISRVINMDENSLSKIREEARKTYENNFSMQIFEKNLLKYVDKAMEL